jgi:hypothetical protein
VSRADRRDEDDDSEGDEVDEVRGVGAEEVFDKAVSRNEDGRSVVLVRGEAIVEIEGGGR